MQTDDDRAAIGLVEWDARLQEGQTMTEPTRVGTGSHRATRPQARSSSRAAVAEKGWAGTIVGILFALSALALILAN